MGVGPGHGQIPYQGRRGGAWPGRSRLGRGGRRAHFAALLRDQVAARAPVRCSQATVALAPRSGAWHRQAQPGACGGVGTTQAALRPHCPLDSPSASGRCAADGLCRARMLCRMRGLLAAGLQGRGQACAKGARPACAQGARPGLHYLIAEQCITHSQPWPQAMDAPRGARVLHAHACALALGALHDHVPVCVTVTCLCLAGARARAKFSLEEKRPVPISHFPPTENNFRGILTFSSSHTT